jgi:hypothetical protein
MNVIASKGAEENSCVNQWEKEEVKWKEKNYIFSRFHN